VFWFGGRVPRREAAGTLGGVPADLPFPRPWRRAADQPGAGQVVLDTARGLALWVFDAGLACCAVECAAALARLPGGPPSGAAAAPANVLLVAGTVTDKLAPLVLRAYDGLPEPRFVVSFGACSNSGGPYWDSYCVTKGADQFLPVDVYVPGCPPRPEALLHGLDVLAAQIAARQRPPAAAGTGRPA
jgi:NADH-quinone oxidoreductase subunit B